MIPDEPFEVRAAANDKAEGVGLFQSGQYFKSYQAGPSIRIAPFRKRSQLFFLFSMVINSGVGLLEFVFR